MTPDSGKDHCLDGRNGCLHGKNHRSTDKNCCSDGKSRGKQGGVIVGVVEVSSLWRESQSVKEGGGEFLEEGVEQAVGFHGLTVGR